MKDYIIICDDGNPLKFEDDTIIVYGDIEDTRDDICETDMGIAVLQYGDRNKGFQNVTVFKPNSEEVHGTFTYNFRIVEDFRNQLNWFINEHPFKN